MAMEKSMKRNVLIAIAIAVFAAPAFADDSATKGKAASGRTGTAAALFQRLDRNNDGFVTRDEAGDARELQGRFAELDKDNDGKISRSEMQALDAERSAAGSSKARR